MKKKIYLIILLVTPFLANVTMAAGWSDDLTVTSISAYGDSDIIYVYTTGGASYVSGCTVNRWSITASTDARREKMLSLITTAMAAGITIRFKWEDACGASNYHETSSLRLYN